jgi:hypothetical protein
LGYLVIYGIYAGLIVISAVVLVKVKDPGKKAGAINPN